MTFWSLNWFGRKAGFFTNMYILAKSASIPTKPNSSEFIRGYLGFSVVLVADFGLPVSMV